MVEEERKSNRLHFGAAYYPEHWPEECWSEDIRLMKEAGFSVVRMGEFAWSTFEPRHGEYDFGWLEKAIALLAESGIQSVLGTPSAAPPAWLITQYPEILPIDEGGRKVQFGNRCHYCVNSPEFHRAVKEVVSTMAHTFGENPNVIGWQIDNEFNRVCYCDRCHSLFHQFLQEKFETLDNLNEHWTTRYWSQTYSDWEQIPLPIGDHHPGLMLEFRRFITHSYKLFQKLQIDVLRPHLPPQVWITHNFMGGYDLYDHYQISQDLDMASWDYYVGTGSHDYIRSGMQHDLMRSFKRKNFWVMETQPGNVNWTGINTTLKRNEARAIAWHAVGHGADGFLYWQWRAALNGQEQYHGTLIDQSGQPRLFYEDAQRLGRDLSVVSELMAESKSEAYVAILYDYESRWSIGWQPHHKDFDYNDYLLSFYRPLVTRNIPVDFLHPDTPYHGYRVIIAPALLMMNEKRLENIREFLKRGGKLVLASRTGMKDEYNALLPMRQPGPLSELTGVEVEEYYALRDPVPVKGNWFTGESRLWAEKLKILDTKSMSIAAKYGVCNGWLDDQPAIVVRAQGQGLIYYVGTNLDGPSQDAFMERVIQMSHLRSVMDTPSGVEVCKRSNRKGEEFYILINHDNFDKRIKIPWPAHERISGLQGEGEFRLAPFGIAVMTRVRQ
jgi:beta-galactosidase